MRHRLVIGTAVFAAASLALVGCYTPLREAYDDDLCDTRSAKKSDEPNAVLADCLKPPSDPPATARDA